MATQNLVSLQPIIFFVNRKRLRLDLARANTDPRRADGRLNLLERLICYSFLGYLQQILYHIFFYFIIYFKLVFTNSIKQYHLSFGSYILRRLLKTVLNKLIFRETKIVSFLLDFRFDRVAHCIRLKRLVGFKTSQLQALWWAGEALSPPPVRRPALWIGNGCHFCVAQKLSELEQRCVMHARWLKDKCHCMREKNVYRVRTVQCHRVQNPDPWTLYSHPLGSQQAIASAPYSSVYARPSVCLHILCSLVIVWTRCVTGCMPVLLRLQSLTCMALMSSVGGHSVVRPPSCITSSIAYACVPLSCSRTTHGTTRCKT